MFSSNKFIETVKKDWHNFKYNFRNGSLVEVFLKLLNIFIYIVLISTAMFLINGGRGRDGLLVIFAGAFYLTFKKLDNIDKILRGD